MTMLCFHVKTDKLSHCHTKQIIGFFCLKFEIRLALVSPLIFRPSNSSFSLSLTREPIMTAIRTNYFSFPTFVVFSQENRIIENEKFGNKNRSIKYS